MREPKGKDLLATLINLLADQEGCKIKYELEGEEDEEEVQNQTKQHCGVCSKKQEGAGNDCSSFHHIGRYVSGHIGLCG